ncbi:DUF106 domain-containing protein [Candidatus Woesearchaeota archaeon]|nr:DUF106 domain-containing protein [Candidatus Woesearchaeota archaeon]
MGFFSFLDPVMNFLLGWVLNLSPFLGVLILSFILSLLIVLIYKFTTNQDLMRSLKTEIKDLQKQMKELKHDPGRMMEVNKKAMEANMKYMSHSFKPMLFTFLPVILIFGWMNTHLAFEPIMPGQEFTMTVLFEKGASGNITINTPDGIILTGDASRTITDGNAIFTLKAAQGGLYAVNFDFAGKQYLKEVEITSERRYLEPLLSVNDDDIKTITTDHAKTRVIRIGGFGLTWLWSYIIFSIAFSIGLRKLMKVY